MTFDLNFKVRTFFDSLSAYGTQGGQQCQSAWDQADSLLFNGYFPGVCGLAGTRMSPFCILSELRMTEVVVTTAAIRRAKLQSSPSTNQHHNVFCYGWDSHCQDGVWGTLSEWVCEWVGEWVCEWVGEWVSRVNVPISTLQATLGTCCSRQSLALLLTTKHRSTERQNTTKNNNK